LQVPVQQGLGTPVRADISDSDLVAAQQPGVFDLLDRVADAATGCLGDRAGVYGGKGAFHLRDNASSGNATLAMPSSAGVDRQRVRQ
jgi:hypothetical protein